MKILHSETRTFCPFTREFCFRVNGLGQKVYCQFYRNNRCGFFTDLLTVLKSIEKAVSDLGKNNECGTGKDNSGGSDL